MLRTATPSIVLLFPEDPTECFEFGALAFDLADRLQTTIFVMLDLDIGMNEWLCRPFAWDDSRTLDHGKVATFEAAGGRDAVRPLPRRRRRRHSLSHPIRARIRAAARYLHPRHLARSRYARYSEEGPVYVDNMQRLLAKFETAKSLIPAPVFTPAKRPTPHGVIYYGSTTPAMHEALESASRRAGCTSTPCGFAPFRSSDVVFAFIAAHETVFVVEQNRDAQLRSLLMIEGGVDPAKLTPVLHYDGSPITARFITAEITGRMGKGA